MSRIRLVQAIHVFMLGGAVIIPGLVSYLAARDVSIYTVEIIFGVTMLCSMIPSGIIAGRVGDRLVIIFGSLMHLCALTLYLTSDTDNPFAIYLAEVFFGLGLGCMFGSDESLLHRVIEEDGSSKSYKESWTGIVGARILYTAIMYWLGGQLALINPGYPFAFAIFNSLAILTTALLVKQPQLDVQRGDWNGLKRALAQSPELRWVILRFGLLIGVGKTAVWSYEEFFKMADAPVSHGTVMGAAALVTAATVGIVQRRLDVFGPRSKTLLVLICMALSFTAMAAWVAPICFLFVFSIAIAKGYTDNEFAQELHSHIGEDSFALRAALASCRQMAVLVCYLLVLVLLHSSGDYSPVTLLFGLAVAAAGSGILLMVLAPRNVIEA